MTKLAPPVKRYLTGKLPSHSGSQSLANNFKELHKDALIFVFLKAGYMSEEGKPTKKALADGLIDSCEGKALWNLDKVQESLLSLGMNAERKSVNQEIKEPDDMEPRWVNLGTIGTYFNVTANTVGKWLDKLEFRESDGMGSQSAMDLGLVTVSEMNAGGKKTRKIAMWNLYPVQRVLVEAGYELDFDYEKVHKGSGKNSDVQVTTIDERAKQFAKDFVKTFKEIDERHKCRAMIKEQPSIVLKKAEVLLNKPGFFTKNDYLKYMK